MDRSGRFAISAHLLAQNRLRAIAEDIHLLNAWRLARHAPCNAGEMVVEPRHDAYGQLLLAALEGDEVVEIVERDDGFISASTMGPKLYVAPFRRWPSHHRRAMRYAKGRVLDVGAGAGRVSLHLQERGQDVVAIDNSPGAIAVCRRRGVREARVLAFDAIDESLGTFNTIVLFGNNFGLFGTPTKAKQLLRRLHRMTSNDARIIVESRDVERRGGADAPWHRRYRERNIARPAAGSDSDTRAFS
ncbi:MAG: class I SAM-dependent methyltransferase [Actinomycetota bacterium]|nr:class I SAM-dependent methyltransferase [Actinomycetota bacterium]